MKVKLKEKTYDIDDPTSFFLDLFSFRSENSSHFPTDHWELVLGALIGSMGSGKTTLLKFIAKLGYKIYANEFSVFLTNNVIRLLDWLNEHPEKRKKVIFIFLDDALTKPGADSRRSMSQDNVKASQNLSIIRHLLACEDENGNPDPRFKSGFCVIMYGIQDPARLDPFIRRNLHITLYKTYYDSLEKTIDSDNLQFIKEVTEDSMYRHNYEARSYALGITKTGGCLRMYFPKADFEIPVVYTEENNQSAEIIVNELLKLDLESMKDYIVKGFIRDFCSQNKLNIDTINIPEIIDLARYRQWKMKNSAENAEEDRAQNQLREIERKSKCASIHEYLALGKTIDQICKKFSITKSWYQYNYPKWCKEMGIKPINIKKNRSKLKEIEESDPTSMEVAE